MICDACKKEITDGSVFCNFCGSKQTANATELSLDEMLEKVQAVFTQIFVKQIMVKVRQICFLNSK